MKSLKDSGKDIVILRLDPMPSTKGGFISGSITPTSIPNWPSLSSLPRDKPIIIYDYGCPSCAPEQEQQAYVLAVRLLRSGFDKDKVYVLQGGYYAWTQGGYPVE